MIEKEFIPYEEALALKELGFDKPCFMFYEQGTSNKYLQKGIDDDYWGDYSEPRDWNSIPNKPWKPFCQCISVPLYQQAFRWFRENYNIIGLVEGGYDNGKNIFTYIIWNGFRDNIFDNYYSTYEEAELECLRKLIKLVQVEEINRR
jgi:hypothetical protein